MTKSKNPFAPSNLAPLDKGPITDITIVATDTDTPADPGLTHLYEEPQGEVVDDAPEFKAPPKPAPPPPRPQFDAMPELPKIPLPPVEPTLTEVEQRERVKWQAFVKFLGENGDKIAQARYPNPPQAIVDTIWQGVRIYDHHEIQFHWAKIGWTDTQGNKLEQ